MEYARHQDAAKSCKSIASNTHAIMCAVCGSKQYLKPCPRDHHHHPDPICMAGSEWFHCADPFGKSYSRIEPLFSSPSLVKPLFPNTAILQTPPNVFHSHSSVGVRMVPSSNPCINKEKKDAKATNESIHNSASSVNQSSRQKPRPGSRPRSRAGYENLENPRGNPTPRYVSVPGEPNCCQVPCRPHAWQNCCPRLMPYPYQPLAYPVPQIIPVYVPIPHDCEGIRNPSCETASCQTERDFNDETEEMNDYDFEKLAKELVMEQGFNSGDDNEEVTNLDLLVDKFESGMNVEKIIGDDEKENNENVNSSVKSQGDGNESKKAFSEGNDKDEWSSNDNYQEKEAEDGDEKWAKRSIDKQASDLSSCSESNKSHKYSRAGEEADVLAFTSFKPNIKSENNLLNNVKNTERPLSKEKASMTDFQEKSLKSPETPMQMNLNDYGCEGEKQEENPCTPPESIAGSEDENNYPKSQKSENAGSIKQEYDENLIAKPYENNDEGNFHSNSQKDDLSDENNESDEENSEEKYENTSENPLDLYDYKEPNPTHQDNKKEGFKVLNVYKKEIVADDVKEDWLDTEEEFTPSRKESCENSKNRNLVRERISDQNEQVHFIHCKDNRRDIIKINHDENEGSVKIKKRVEEKDDSHYHYKKVNVRDNYSPRMKPKLGINTHDQPSGDKFKSVSNKLIYTAIINKKEEKEKVEISPFNSPRWREEVKKQSTKRPEGKKRWMI